MGVPNNIVVPFVGIEFDSTRAISGPSILPFKALIFGQITTGSMTVHIPYFVRNADEVGVLAGFGSQLHLLSIDFFAANTQTAVYIMGVNDDGSAVDATTTYTLTGTATKVGEQVVYIDSTRIAVGVNIGDTAAVINAALTTKITDFLNILPVTVIDDTLGELTFTANNAGVSAGEFDIREEYLTTDVPVAGISTTIVVTPGVTNPDTTAAVTAMLDEWYNVIVFPWYDSTNLDVIEAKLLINFGPTKQIDGLAYFGHADTVANSIIFSTAAARNSQSMVMVDTYKYPKNPQRIAASVAAKAASSVENDPGRPLHRITINSILPPVAIEKRTLDDLNTLTINGVCTLNPNAFGGPQTFGMVTMYLRNSSNVLDNAYRQQNTLYILMFLRFDFVSQIVSKYGRARLANSADKIKAGLQILTEDNGRLEAIAIARNWEFLGLIEDLDQFIAEIQCKRSTTNENRLEWILPPNLMNQFIVGSGDMQFLL